MIERNYIDTLREKTSELELEMSRPDVVSHQKKYQAVLSEYNHKKHLLEKVENYYRLVDQKEDNISLIEAEETDEDLREMAREELEELDQSIEAANSALMLALLPPDPTDSRNTIIEIRAGTGGDEAALFVGDLYRMYARYAESSGWKIQIIDASESNVGGYKEIVCALEGQHVFKRLKYESGTHRVQRIPVTESSGRIHTSASTVAVLPEADEVDEIDVAPEEIRVDLFCASGPGGQSVNKSTSAVRITHLESGIVVQSQDERSQLRNRERAMKVLKARLLDKKQSEIAAKEAGERRSQVGSGDRSERIRTYNFPQNRVTDHRINLTLYNLDRIMEGELSELIDALNRKDVEDQLSQLSFT